MSQLSNDQATGASSPNIPATGAPSRADRAAARRRAARIGMVGGWHIFRMSLRSAQDQGFYLFVGLLAVGYLVLMRDKEVAGTDLLMPAVLMPSLLGGLILFACLVGAAVYLSMEREDGTLLRVKAVPHGMTGHLFAHLVQHVLGIVPMLAVLLLPAMVLFDDLMHNGPTGWLMMAGYVVLGMAAILPFGIILGSLVPGSNKLGTWGMVPTMVLLGTSGILYPITAMWGWVQAAAQIFPMYWLGLGMRSAFLPDSAAAAEMHGSWQTWAGLGVLTAWAALGCAMVPWVLRRMARRQTHSHMEAAKQAAMQVVR